MEENFQTPNAAAIKNPNTAETSNCDHFRLDRN
jgi:hypothetical protein